MKSFKLCTETNEGNCPSYDHGDCNNQFISRDRKHPIKCQEVKKCNYRSYEKYFTEYPLLDKIERSDTLNENSGKSDSKVKVTHYPQCDISLNEEEWKNQVTLFFGQIGYQIVDRNEPQYNYEGYWVRGARQFIQKTRS